MGGSSSSLTTELLKPNGTSQSNFPLVYPTRSRFEPRLVSIVDNVVHSKVKMLKTKAK